MVYTNSRFHNTLNHAVSLSGGMELADWLAQFDQSYTKSNTPRIETGRQTAQEVSSTRLDVSHRMTDSLSIELAGAQTLQFIEQSPDYYDWSTNGWLTYRATTRIDFSLGYRWGYTDFDPGAYMTYSEPMARLRWRVTDKISVNVQAGQERRQIHKHGVPVQETPTYDGSLEWRPFKYTGVMVRAQRSVSPSYFTNSVSENQGWSADLEQRLLGRYTLNAGIGRQRSHFSGSHTEFDADVTVEDVLDENGEVIGQIYHVTYTPRNVIDLRNDSTKTFHVRLSTPILQRGTFAVLYRRTENSSDVAGFNFTSHQVGCELSFRF